MCVHKENRFLTFCSFVSDTLLPCLANWPWWWWWWWWGWGGRRNKKNNNNKETNRKKLNKNYDKNETWMIFKLFQELMWRPLFFLFSELQSDLAEWIEIFFLSFFEIVHYSKMSLTVLYALPINFDFNSQRFKLSLQCLYNVDVRVSPANKLLHLHNIACIFRFNSMICISAFGSQLEKSLVQHRRKEMHRL